MKQYSGSLLLILCAFIWGTAFVAQADAAQSIPPFTFSALRSFIGASVLLLFLILRKVFGKKTERIFDKKAIISGVICGVVLCIAMNLQQVGITVYPEGVNNIPGRSGFLTAMYVVMVPLGGLFFKRKVHPLVWVAMVLAVLSLWLLCLKNGFGGIYLGDILMIICALAFTCHIITVDTLGAKADGVALSCIQFFVAGVLSLAVGLFAEPRPALSVLSDAWFSILYVGVLSSGVAYTLQIVGQKRTPPAVASIVMSLESVFAVLGGWVVFHETLSGREIIGCICMFAAVILAQVPQMIKQEHQEG